MKIRKKTINNAKRKIFLRAIGTIDHEALCAFESGVLAKRQRRHTHPFFRRRARVAVQQVQQNELSFAVDSGVTVQSVAESFGVIPVGTEIIIIKKKVSVSTDATTRTRDHRRHNQH